MFKIGNYIRLKEGVRLESGELVNGWAGEIQEVYKKERCCLVIFDAQTIDAMEDSYIIDSIEQGAEPFEYVFSFDDLELSARRDTDEQQMKSLDKLASRVAELEEAVENINHQRQERWIEEFEKSTFFTSLNEYQKENSNFIIETFMELLHNYEYVQPEEWKPENVQKVCLHVVPRKITSESELFENYGDVLEQFITFLGSKQYIDNWKELTETITRIKKRIPEEANNSSNWGMAKSMMMGAQQSGIDFSNEDELKAFLFERNKELSNSRKNERQARIIPLRDNPFRGIGRNQKITVKYKNGDLKSDVKFKKVEQDLIDGKCELIKK